ncbi:unnamed protein product [Brachionus calyciflorus]|uniref:Ribosome biogenesis protein BOP1 homolog n=1 Tax=Brachionus calyciflorus TaxID=104777 RepID=A0A814ETJ3_9BILA|nr:unnamed protein product [Brachionus calyciflorus]
MDKVKVKTQKRKSKHESTSISENSEKTLTKNTEPLSTSLNSNGSFLSSQNEYDIDTSDEEDLRNTIGNVPLKWYDDYDHIGYNLDGEKIAKPADAKRSDELDQFLDKMENPDYWRTVRDSQTGGKVVLSDEDIEIIKRLTTSKYANKDVEEFDTSSFFTQDEMKMPLSGRPEHKRSFIPSNWERLQVGKYVHAIKMGWIKPQIKKEEEDDQPKFYDIWGKDDNDQRKHLHHLPAPKCPLPDNYESYNPPPEYLFDDEEKEKWQNQEPEDRRINFMPKKFPSLRLVPGYEHFIKERFERCLDMYLAPRQRKMRVQVDPQDLLPKLPKPRDLQPFPTTLSITFKGHKSTITSISVHPTGQWLLSSSNDKTVKCWEVSTGRCINTWTFESKTVNCSWVPVQNLCLFSVAYDNIVMIVNPKCGDKVLSSNTDSKLADYSSLHEQNDNSAKGNESDDESEDKKKSETKKPPCTWKFFHDKKNDPNFKAGFRIQLTHQKPVKNVSWHPKGDYFATVLDDKNSNSAVIMHQLSKQKSVRPFAKMNGIVQQVVFHPFKPLLFVATQRYVKVYDLAKQLLVKKLLTNVKWVSSLDVHPGGDNLIIGSYDNRLSWFDLDLSTKPYKTLKHHKKAIRAVAYHKKYPLFASCSDDGTAIVSHGMVYDDLMQNALIVPLKILRGHEITKSIGVTCCKFHPTQPWLFTSGADKTIRLYSN